MIITLSCPVLTLGSDLSQSLWLPLAQSVQMSPVQAGEDREYGNGRFRGVVTAGAQLQYQVTVDPLSQADLATLLAWSGLPGVWYRDDAGAKFFGWYRSPAVTRHRDDPDAAVSFTITQLTAAE